MTLPTLYTRSKLGSLWSWKVWTEGNAIKTEFGQVDGAKQIANRIATPKNEGRANATTAGQQADAEAQSMWQHQRDRRYRESPEEAHERVFLPMLAKTKVVKPTDEGKIRFPADLQIKYDGLRAMAYWDGGEIRFLSRSGKYFNVPHIKRVLEKFVPEGHILDGELYHHGTPLQTIASWVKRLQPDTFKLSYRTYDCPEFGGDTGPWKERRKQLEAVLKLCPDTKLVTLVQSLTVKSIREAYDIVEHKFMLEGYEGGILRIHTGEYEYSKRSNYLLKLKLFDEGDFEVIGFKTGELGTKEANAIIWKCITAEGKDFDVRPTGTIADREKWYAIELKAIADKKKGRKVESRIGQMYSVKHKGWTIEGKPFIPVGLAFKEDR